METDGRLTTALEVKAVDVSQRIIEGYAATFGNLDLNGDVIDEGAFTKTLNEKPPAGVAVFIGHQSSALPIGIPLEIRQDGRGLYTKTRIFKTSAGDDLLATARELRDAGQPLGMSIGFQTRDAKWASTKTGGQHRVLTDVALMEYSYAANQVIASPPALVTSVKTKGATAPTMAEDHFKSTTSTAAWSTAYRNALPDSAFAYVEPTGTQDGEQKTTPRNLRHFPHHDADGALNIYHLKVALDRAAHSPFGEKAMAHLERHAVAEDIGERGDAGKVAQQVLADISTTLADLSDESAECATDLEAAGRLGFDGTKVSVRLKGTMRSKLKSISDALGELMQWAEGEDSSAPTEGDEPKTVSHLRTAHATATRITKTVGDLGQTNLGQLHGGLKSMAALHDSVCDGGEGCPLYETDGTVDLETQKTIAEEQAAKEAEEKKRNEPTGFETTFHDLDELEAILAGVGTNGQAT